MSVKEGPKIFIIFENLSFSLFKQNVVKSTDKSRIFCWSNKGLSFPGIETLPGHNRDLSLLKGERLASWRQG